VAEKEERPSFPWVPVIILILVGSGVVLTFQQLTSSRPAGGDTRLATNTFEGQNIDARLWQDPFGVTAADWKRNKNSLEEHSIGSFQNIVIDKCFAPMCPPREELSSAEQREQAEILAKQVRILAVMIPGGPYVEDVERRLRSRRAVIEGLAIARCDPEEYKKIGYFWVPWQPIQPSVAACVSTLKKYRDGDETDRSSKDAPVYPTRNCQESDDHNLLVPYEWCEGTSLGSYPRAMHVLVLWLNDDAFQDAPLARLADLISWFRFKLLNAVDPFTPVFDVLGPDNSGTLHQMVLEAKEYRDKPPPCLATTNIYSNQASAAESRLLYGLRELGEHPTCGNLIEQAVDRQGSGNHVTFQRINILDKEIVDSLWQELDRHGVKKNEKNHPVAIISEEDTYYARALSSTFCDPDANGQTISNVYSYTYLRGIDGKLPSKAKDDKESSDIPKSIDENSKPSSQPRERMEGVSQADDIRRLAEKLQKFEKRGGSASLKAVGLLGSDVYDKLELLKALRPMLPEAIFFTNNLDARLGHPDELIETHNLIVVSARDLALENDQNPLSSEKYQRFPPFRDSAQTALFEATLTAMGYLRPGDPAIPKSPLIFEIGRDGAKKIGVADDQRKLSRSYKRYLRHLGWLLTFGSLLVAWGWLVSRVSLVPSNRGIRPGDTGKKKLIGNDDLAPAT
jgi:hypothetical protein